MNYRRAQVLSNFVTVAFCGSLVVSCVSKPDSAEKPSAEKPSAEKPSAEKPSAEKPSAEKAESGTGGAGAYCTAGSAFCLPSFSGVSRDGTEWSRESLLGKIVLLNFYSTWCEPCVREIAGFARVYTEWSDRNFVILGLLNGSADVSDEALAGFREATGMNYPSIDTSVQIGVAFGDPSGVPISYLYDSTGRLAYHHNGVLSEEELRAQLAKLTKD